MEDLSWERNISFPWSNINHHQHQDIDQETFIFGSENIFLNPIQDLRKPDPPTCSNPLPSSNGSTSQYLSQTTLAKGKTVIPITTPTHADRVTCLESLNCLFSDKNSNVDPLLDGISVIFSDFNNLCNKNITNNISDGSSTSVAKDTDDGIVSQSSNERRLKRSRSNPGRPVSSNINFRQTSESDETDSEAIAQMKEMIYREAAFRPVSFAEDEVAEKRRRKNVKISSDPQTVAARQRRERISDRIRA
ncbi:transcription factor bHLH87-like protein, partial [Tanacetum coccineum]